ncbi:MAG: HAD-IA family hydrolase [Clostridia bacterium]|nr:HAD-IA family hydrolase [Clostridia bacterium]
MGNNRLHTVAFDLDGTLSDPMRGLTSGFRYAFRKMKIDYGDEGVLKSFIGPPLRDEWMKRYSLTRERAEEAVAYFREYYSIYGWWDNDLYEGIPELLSALKAAGKRIVLATSKPDVHSRKILARFNLTPYFDFSEGASFDTSREKKSDVLSYALSRVGVSERELDGVIMVGDTKYDIDGAREVGVKSVGVLWGYGTRDDLLSHGADFLARNVDELYKILL